MIPIIPVDDAVPPNPDAPRIGEKTLSGLKNPPPLALYIHIPWCVRKCPYCDFNSHELKDNLAESQYIDALIADLTSDAQYLGQKITLHFYWWRHA